MSSLSRRRFLTLLAGAAASPWLPLAPAKAAGKRVVVIGGALAAQSPPGHYAPSIPAYRSP